MLMTVQLLAACKCAHEEDGSLIRGAPFNNEAAAMLLAIDLAAARLMARQGQHPCRHALTIDAPLPEMKWKCDDSGLAL